jgi:RNA polymerase I-specific transcription initiation factor RRN3
MLQHDKLLEAQKLQQQKPSSTANGRRRSTTIQTAATIELGKKKGGGGGVGGLGKGTNPLDSFFPFDPYLLCRSHKFISPFYKSWDEPGAEIDDKSTEDEGSVDDLDVNDGASSSSDSESSSDCENCSMLHEDDDNDVAKHQENQFVMEMLPCSFEEVIPRYRKQSISSGGSW